MSPYSSDDILRQIAQSISTASGEEFFCGLATALCRALEADFAFIGQLDPDDPNRIHVMAVCVRGKIAENFSYHLHGTPCENVVGREPCHYPRDIQSLFPGDHMLVEMGIESYIGHPLFGSAGQPLGLLAVMHGQPMPNEEPVQSVLKIFSARAAAEIERLQADEILRESEERFHATFSQAAVGIAHVAPDGRFLRANQKFCDIVGYIQEEILVRTFQDITHPDDLDADLAYVRRVLAGEIPTYSMEKRYLRKNGAIVWVNLTVSIVRDSQNSPKYFISVVQDISARKQAEAEMQKLSSAIEQTADSVIITDRDGVIQYVNSACEETAGFSRNESLGKKPNIVKSGKHKPEFYERLWKTILRGEVFRDVFINRRKNGDLYYEQKTITPLKDEHGHVTHFVSTGKDITDRMRAEEALAQSAAEWTYSMDFIEDALCLVGLDDRLIRANRAFYQFTGYTPEQARGRELAGLMHPQGEVTPCPLCQARQARRDVRIIKEADDNRTGRPIEVTIRVVRDRDGNPASMLLGIHDLSRTRQIEEELRASRAGLLEAQRIARLGNWDWNLLTNELHWSDEVYRIFGMTPQQSRITAETFLNSVHPDDRVFVTETARSAMVEKRPFDLNFRITRSDGMERIVHEQAEVTFDGNDKPIRMVGTVQDITERKDAEARLNYLAHYDTLTGLPNRVLLYDRLNQVMTEADRNDRLVAVMFLDLDRFKIVNDTLGHDVGDVLLKSVAERLMTCVRAGDTISRLGGDEFTVVLADVEHGDDVARVAQKIIDSFVPPFHIDGRELFMSPSIGITLYPFDDNNLESLLRNADAAMYHAKEMGRNTFRFYTAELNRRTAKRLALETALRHALERHELLLHYQPQVNLKTGRITGLEALLRWQHPEMGLIPPLDFIPLAEETGLIIPIGEWVLRTACAQARAWHDAGFRNLQIAVNLSGRQLQHLGLAKVVKNALKEAGLDPRQLDLELTESLLMHNTGETLAAMDELHTLGVTFSMDDFGTGYSSLSYLKRFPIDIIKIDQSFVRDIPRDPDDAAIAQAIIAIAHSLGMKVIAEGVETAKQLAFMRSHKCDGVQGYHFSKPVTAEAITKLLQKARRVAARRAAEKPCAKKRKHRSPRGG